MTPTHPESELVALLELSERAYRVWDATYYNCPHKMFPGSDEFVGTFSATDDDHLMAQLVAKGIDPARVRWEIQDDN